MFTESDQLSRPLLDAPQRACSPIVSTNEIWHDALTRDAAAKACFRLHSRSVSNYLRHEPPVSALYALYVPPRMLSDMASFEASSADSLSAGMRWKGCRSSCVQSRDRSEARVPTIGSSAGSGGLSR